MRTNSASDVVRVPQQRCVCASIYLLTRKSVVSYLTYNTRLCFSVPRRSFYYSSERLAAQLPGTSLTYSSKSASTGNDTKRKSATCLRAVSQHRVDSVRYIHASSRTIGSVAWDQYVLVEIKPRPIVFIKPRPEHSEIVPALIDNTANVRRITSLTDRVITSTDHVPPRSSSFGRSASSCWYKISIPTKPVCCCTH